MNIDTLKSMSDGELGQVIAVAQGELKERAEKRREDAIEEIRRIAASVQIEVSINGAGRKPARVKPALRAGERYQHPSDPAKVYIVGKGRPPEWFDTLRAKGALPRAGTK